MIADGMPRDTRDKMTFTLIMDKEMEYYVDGPIYVDLVLSNTIPMDQDWVPLYPAYPRMTYEYGAGLLVQLTNGAGALFQRESPLRYNYRNPPLGRYKLRKGQSWRWSVDIRSMCEKAQFREGSYLSPGVEEGEWPTGNFALIIQPDPEFFRPASDRIRLCASNGCPATAQALQTLRTKAADLRLYGDLSVGHMLFKPDLFDTKYSEQDVLPTFRRMIRAFSVISKMRQGQAESEVLSRMPTEAEWGIWADDIAAARYAYTLKKDKETAPQLRKEIEAKFPGTAWLLDILDGDPDYLWLNPVFELRAPPPPVKPGGFGGRSQ